MTVSMLVKVMTVSWARRTMMSFMAALVMMESMVILVSTSVRTMIMSPCPVLGVVTSSMATLAMTFLMVKQRTTLVMEDLTSIRAF
jgi:hypothetical protein